MKKIISLILAIMPAMLLHSQEAEVGNYTEFTVIPRLEVSPQYSPQDGANFNLGNSSIYSLFEGKYKKLSWSVANHWIHSGGDYGWPYTNLGYSNTTNFIDCLNIGYTVGEFTLTAGKQMIQMGGIEFDYWDWDIHPSFASPLWHYLACFQWGLGVTWKPSERNSFIIQATKSPHGEKVLDSKLFAYNAQWRGEYEWATFLWSITAMQNYEGGYSKVFSLGQSFYIDDSWTATVNWNHCPDINCSSVQGSIDYSISDKFAATATGTFALDNACCGLVLYYTPIEDLRLHTYVGYSDNLTSYQNFMFNIGARWLIRLVNK